VRTEKVKRAAAGELGHGEFRVLDRRPELFR